MSPAIISGSVVDDQGRPVHGARVFITAGPTAVPDIAALTDPEGRFALSAPVPGGYVVAAAGHEGETASEEVDVAGEEAELTLRLPATD